VTGEFYALTATSASKPSMASQPLGRLTKRKTQGTNESCEHIIW